MDFHLHRGTNCNEAWHKKLNSIYPIHCGESLGDACLDVLVYLHQLMSLQGSNKDLMKCMIYSDMYLVR